MNKVMLGKTMLSVSKMGFGGIPIQQMNYHSAVRLVNQAWERGINFFDTSRAYTTSESIIGEALEKKRSQVVLASKTSSRNTEHIESDLKTTLKKLRTNYIDLYQLHNVTDWNKLEEMMSPGSVFDYLFREKEKGSIRYLGITSHRLETVIKALKEAPELFDTVMVAFNYIEDEPLEELFPLTVQKNVGVICMKPLGGGVFTNIDSAIRWSLNKSPGIIIPGIAAVSELEQNLEAAKSTLTSNDIENLEKDKKELSKNFCRRCGYCMPCPNNININFIMKAETYFKRYGWENLKKKHIDFLKAGLNCIECGECEQKCPYELPLTKLVKANAQKMLSEIDKINTYISIE